MRSQRDFSKRRLCTAALCIAALYRPGAVCSRAADALAATASPPAAASPAATAPATTLPATAPADDGLSIDVQTAKTAVHVFDPAHRPAYLPEMSPSEAALTVSQFGFTAGMSGAIVDQVSDPSGQTVAAVRIDHVEVHATLAITIWLPTHYTEKLRRHEEGHRTISLLFYKDADAIACTLAAAYIGQTLQGHGASAQDAAHAAIETAIAQLTRDYMHSALEASQRVQQLYDNITAHGSNNIPEDQAIQQALAEAQQTQSADPTTR